MHEYARVKMQKTRNQFAKFIYTIIFCHKNCLVGKTCWTNEIVLLCVLNFIELKFSTFLFLSFQSKFQSNIL